MNECNPQQHLDAERNEKGNEIQDNNSELETRDSENGFETTVQA
jgi:hypothetical protein